MHHPRANGKEAMEKGSLQQQQQRLSYYITWVCPPIPYGINLSPVSLTQILINEVFTTTGQTPGQVTTYHLLYTVDEAILLLDDIAYMTTNQCIDNLETGFTSP